MALYRQRRKYGYRKKKSVAPSTALLTTRGIRTLPKITKPRAQQVVATVGMVKRMIGRRIENKMCSHAPFSAGTSFNSTITSGDVYPVLPHVQAGNEDCNRLGSSIQPKGLYVKGELGLNGNTQANNKPIVARVMILSQRNIRSESEIALFDWGSLLKSNDDVAAVSSSIPYNSFDSNIYPVNKDSFTVHYDKKFYLTPVASEGSSQEVRAGQHKFFSCKIKCPKNLIWDDSAKVNSLFCTNFCPFIVIGYQYADDQGGDTVMTRVIANCRSFLYFEDA